MSGRMMEIVIRVHICDEQDGDDALRAAITGWAEAGDRVAHDISAHNPYFVDEWWKW